jgi:hypothetical protein
MVKCLENLVTLYRTLITLCGILIVVYVSYSPQMTGVPTPGELKAFGDKLDFFGLKFPVAGICNVGSILVVVLLIMMLNSTRTSKKLPLKELADAGFWHGQFLGLSVLLTFCSFILLPIVAVASAQTTVWMRPPVPANVSFWDSTLSPHSSLNISILNTLLHKF